MKVRPLPPFVVNKIYAGEVIQSPSSVVKELMENSIDAGATSIAVFVRGSGLSFIKVVDNGEGISREDLPNVIKKNWSSKIRTLEDLERISTMGFRGEALHAIASVSRMHIRSSTDGIEGYEIYVEGGNLMDMRPCACGKGTTVIVEDLFFNVPVRRRFLSSSRSESTRIKNTWLNYVLSHENIEFHLRSSNRVQHYRARETLDERIEDIYGVKEKKELREDDLTIILYHINGKAQKIFVNRRPVVDSRITEMLGRYDIRNFVLFVEVPPALIDVNVHPQKLQVRFSRSLKFYDRLSRFVRGRKTVIRMEENLFARRGERATDERKEEGIFEWKDYIVVPSRTKLLFIHRQRALKKILESDVVSRKRLSSTTLPVPMPIKFRVSESDMSLLRTYGFDIVELDKATVLKGIPEIMEGATPEEIMEVLSAFSDRKGPFDLKRFVNRLLSVASRHYRMKSRSIVERLFSMENPALTSEGEVVIYELPAEKIEEKFL